jgi:hypothetical protein
VVYVPMIPQTEAQFKGDFLKIWPAVLSFCRVHVDVVRRQKGPAHSLLTPLRRGQKPYALGLREQGAFVFTIPVVLA